MADCLGELGRELPCNNAVGGIKAAYLIQFNTVVKEFDVAKATVLTDLGAVTAYKWDVDVKSSSNLIQTLTSANGSTSINQVVTLGLKKTEWSTDNEILLWAHGMPLVVIHYNTGQAKAVGLDFGSNMDTAVSDSGAAIADPNIYTITVSADCRTWAAELTGATFDDPFEGMTSQVTVVTGMPVDPA